jgi:hypothetical protein
MAGKTRPPDEEASFWFTWTMAGATIFVGVVFAFILS